MRERRQADGRGEIGGQGQISEESGFWGGRSERRFEAQR